jgi:GTPase SAR1 family protein
MPDPTSFKITMLGPSGVGKTTILTVMHSLMEEAVVNTVMRLNPGKPDDEISKAQATGMLLNYRKKLLKLLDEDNFTCENSLDGTNINAEYYFHLSNIQKPKSKKLLFEFQDYPGGWMVPDSANRNKVISYLKDSPVTIIAIDTPALIEQDGKYHETINMGDIVKFLLRDAYEAVDVSQSRLVIFVPVKCEKYCQNGQSDKIRKLIHEKYKVLLADLKQRNSSVAVVIAPIQTVGGVAFTYVGRPKTPGEIPPFYFQHTKEASFKPVNAEQPLRYILSFALRSYLAEKQSKRNKFVSFFAEILGVDDDLKKAIDKFANECKDGTDGFEVVQGRNLLSINS